MPSSQAEVRKVQKCVCVYGEVIYVPGIVQCLVWSLQAVPGGPPRGRSKKMRGGYGPIPLCGEVLEKV